MTIPINEPKKGATAYWVVFYREEWVVVPQPSGYAIAFDGERRIGPYWTYAEARDWWIRAMDGEVPKVIKKELEYIPGYNGPTYNNGNRRNAVKSTSDESNGLWSTIVRAYENG